MRWALLFLLLSASAASATADDNRAEARAHHELGKVHFEQHRYRDALQEFKRAFDLAPLPDLLYNIGRCQEQLGQLAPAAESYRRYLAARQNAEDRGELEAHIQALDKMAGATTPLLGRSSAGSTARAQPVWKRAWVWAVIGGGVVAGVAVGLGVGLGMQQQQRADAMVTF